MHYIIAPSEKSPKFRGILVKCYVSIRTLSAGENNPALILQGRSVYILCHLTLAETFGAAAVVDERH